MPKSMYDIENTMQWSVFKKTRRVSFVSFMLKIKKHPILLLFYFLIHEILSVTPNSFSLTRSKKEKLKCNTCCACSIWFVLFMCYGNIPCSFPKCTFRVCPCNVACLKINTSDNSKGHRVRVAYASLHMQWNLNCKTTHNQFQFFAYLENEIRYRATPLSPNYSHLDKSVPPYKRIESHGTNRSWFRQNSMQTTYKVNESGYYMNQYKGRALFGHNPCRGLCRTWHTHSMEASCPWIMKPYD